MTEKNSQCLNYWSILACNLLGVKRKHKKRLYASLQQISSQHKLERGKTHIPTEVRDPLVTDFLVASELLLSLCKTGYWIFAYTGSQLKGTIELGKKKSLRKKEAMRWYN